MHLCRNIIVKFRVQTSILKDMVCVKNKNYTPVREWKLFLKNLYIFTDFKDIGGEKQINEQN